MRRQGDAASGLAASPADGAADPDGLGELDVVVVLVVALDDVDAGAELVPRCDDGAGEVGVDVRLGALVGSGVVSVAPCDAGLVETGSAGEVAGDSGSSPPGSGTDGAAGPPSRLTTTMIK
jgi:hypothetical protein